MPTWEIGVIVTVSWLLCFIGGFCIGFDYCHQVLHGKNCKCDPTRR